MAKVEATVTRTFRTAIRCGEDFITIEETIVLPAGASDEQIQEAYKTLIKKNHPDQQGSEWLAARINQARDLLLKKQAPAGEP